MQLSENQVVIYSERLRRGNILRGESFLETAQGLHVENRTPRAS